MAEIIKTRAGVLKAEIVFDGNRIAINPTTFKYIIMDSQYGVIGSPNIGISVPVCELSFSVPDYNKGIALLKAKETKVEVQIAADENKFSGFIYKYNITNADINMADYPIITLYCIYDLGEFMTKNEQKSYKDKTFIELLDKIELVPIYKDKISGITTDDKMTWIRPNVSEYQFLSDSCKYINNQEHLILIAPVVHKNQMQLKVISYDKEIKTEPKNGLILGDRTESEYENIIIANTFKIETSRGAYQYNIGSENYIPVLRLPSQKQEDENSIFSFLTKAFKSDPAPKEKKSNKPMPCKLDMGNTHEKFWEARTLNEKRILNLYQVMVIAESETTFIENEIQLLDTIYLENRLPGENGTLLEGSFIILGISKFMSNERFSMQLILGRDFFTGGK